MMNKENSVTLGKKNIWIIIGIMAGIIVILGAMLYLMIFALGNRNTEDQGVDQTLHYTYLHETSQNGMKLHVLQTKPVFVTLEAIHNNVTLAGYAGINGGFFYGDQLLSIGVVDGIPVNKSIGNYGTGSENVKYARGTLVWDGAAEALSVQVVKLATELKVKDHNRFWAQGGISMSLGNDAQWEEQAAKENAPFPDDSRLRSAAVYDQKGYLYLIVSETKGTLASFRQAIKETFGDRQLVDGVFLDGDGSSQLLSKEASLAGDNRPVVQMLRILK